MLLTRRKQPEVDLELVHPDRFVHGRQLGPKTRDLRWRFRDQLLELHDLAVEVLRAH